MEWEDEVDFQLPYGEWIRLFRHNGLLVEDLIEIQPSSGAISTYRTAAEEEKPKIRCWRASFACENTKLRAFALEIPIFGAPLERMMQPSAKNTLNLQPNFH